MTSSSATRGWTCTSPRCVYVRVRCKGGVGFCVRLGLFLLLQSARLWCEAKQSCHKLHLHVAQGGVGCCMWQDPALVCQCCRHAELCHQFGSGMWLKRAHSTKQVGAQGCFPLVHPFPANLLVQTPTQLSVHARAHAHVRMCRAYLRTLCGTPYRTRAYCWCWMSCSGGFKVVCAWACR